MFRREKYGPEVKKCSLVMTVINPNSYGMLASCWIIVLVVEGRNNFHHNNIKIFLTPIILSVSPGLTNLEF